MMSAVIFFYYLGWGDGVSFSLIYYKSILGSYTAVGPVTAFLATVCPTQRHSGRRNNKQGFKSMGDKNCFTIIYAIQFLLLSLKNLFDFCIVRIYHSAISNSFWIPSVDTYCKGECAKMEKLQNQCLFMMWAEH